MSSDTPYIAALAHSEHVKYIRRRNSDSFRLKYSLNNKERKELIRETNVHCLVLFEYYLRMASTENVPINDQDAADYFDWTKTTAKRHRLSLTHAGWYAGERATLKSGRRVAFHYLGKDEVRAAGLAPKSTPSDKKPKPNKKPTTTLFVGD
jgi:hypothetical protein